MSDASLPPCGLYRIVKPLAGVEPGHLVYFHNHGNPGAGIYFPESWTHNRAIFAPKGRTLAPDFDPGALHPLPAEGFYRVDAAFHCCAKKCMRYEPGAMLQLGYNGAGRGILFVPELRGGMISTPERGTLVDDQALGHLVPLKIVERQAPDVILPRGIMIH